jgi:uncharacterized protein (DUF58 family)
MEGVESKFTWRAHPARERLVTAVIAVILVLALSFAVTLSFRSLSRSFDLQSLVSSRERLGARREVWYTLVNKSTIGRISQFWFPGVNRFQEGERLLKGGGAFQSRSRRFLR